MDAGATNVELIRPYLPRLLLHWIGETPNTPFRELDGTIAFVDISGFTKLSERLAKRGKVGAEELTDAIGTCFTRLLAIAYGNGGSLLKFGGDALLMFFSGAGHAEKAARAAIGMRRELRDIGKMDCSGVPVRLRMSVGVHTGTFHFFLVGESHRELIITGPAASETVLMESTAEAGEIVVSPTTAAQLPPNVVGAAKGPGFLLRREPTGIAPERPEPEPRIDDREILRYVPGAVRDQLLGGTKDAEHRRVTIAFIHFDGMDELLNEEGAFRTSQHLHTLVRDVQQAVDRHEVSFLSSDIDRDGGKIILT
ncbi:MAG: adenylate/guanylate cyclase domain-containing protein, partial [Actinomycetota bacterium]